MHNTLPGVSSAGSAMLFYRYAGIEPPVATRAACPANNSPAQSFPAAGMASLHWRGRIGIFTRCVELGHRHPVCVRQRARPSTPRVLAAQAARPTSFCAAWASLQTPLRTSFALLSSCQGTSYAQQVSELVIVAAVSQNAETRVRPELLGQASLPFGLYLCSVSLYAFGASLHRVLAWRISISTCPHTGSTVLQTRAPRAHQSVTHALAQPSIALL